jgi:peptide/nickel transport system permease protein
VRRFIAARLAQSAIIIVVVTVVAFLLLRLAPGDPFTYDAPNITPAIRAQWREKFGYNRPLPVQLARYVANVARGDFGYSTLQRRPARDAIAEALPRRPPVFAASARGARGRRGSSSACSCSRRGCRGRRPG